MQHGFMGHLYRHLQGYIFQAALKLICEKVECVEDGETDQFLCGCDICYIHGLPCAYEFNVYLLASSPIPLEDKHTPWQKSSLMPKQFGGRAYYNFNDEI
ncbi:hypothetical protein Scep_027949 [Stephania cephalantha]|uniref:Uncharacterized protein n=1 Tax=Stephania cephalantha TaxID=152367 RepID=A0AAP0EC80_9MAGN